MLKNDANIIKNHKNEFKKYWQKVKCIFHVIILIKK